MGVKRSNSARVLRRSSSCSLSGLSLGLDVERLDLVLHQLVPLYARDRDLLAMIRSEGSRIVDRLWHLRGWRMGSNHNHHDSSSSSQHPPSCCHSMETSELLSHAVSILCSFLSSCTSNVPAVVVFDVHSLVGQMRQVQRSFDSAIISYLKALWIASSCSDVPIEHLARTQHRIGQLYGHQGHVLKAKTLLLKALENYQVAHVSSDHPIAIEARLLVKDYEISSSNTPSSSSQPTNWSSDDSSWSSSRGGHDTRPSLPLIAEESSEFLA